MGKLGAIELSTEILTKANIGFWAFELDEGKPPRMYVDNGMLALLGLKEQLPPEDTYHAWYDNIDKEHYGVVADSVERMIDGQHAEVQYPWNHPQLGTIIVRCGGARNFSYKNGIRIEGCHQNITEIIHYQKIDEKRQLSKDQILSTITKQLYSYNIVLDLQTGKYTTIIGTGMPQLIDILVSTNDYRQSYERFLNLVWPAYRAKLRSLVSLDYLRNTMDKPGFIGSNQFAATMCGDEIWGEVNVFIGHNEQGQAIANILGRDVTESHKAETMRERELRASAAKDQLLSGIAQTLYGFNINANLSTGKFNVIRGTGAEKIVEFFENRQDKTYSTVMDELFRHVDADAVKNVRTLLSRDYLLGRGEKSGFLGSIEIPLMLDNCAQWCEVNVFMGMNEAGHPIVNVLGRDITDIHERQIQHERELKATAAKDQILSGITQSLYGFNITVNLDTLACSVIKGTGLDCLLGEFENITYFPDIIEVARKHTPPQHAKALLDIIGVDTMRAKSKAGANGFAGSAAFLSNCPVHGYHWCEANVFYGVDENGNSTANLLCRDITEARRQAETAEKLQVERQANKAKSTFLFNMSHDIRTPMNAIIGFTDLSIKHINDPARAHDYLSKIKTSGQHLLELIDEVLDMARIESGKIKSSARDIDIVEAAEAIVEICRNNAAAKGLEVLFDGSDIRHRKVYADVLHVNQIILNILGNAIKYTPESGTVSYTISEAESSVPGYGKYMMEIADTGIGMSEEFLAHIFDAFTRENTTTVSGIEGTGLGMAIVKKLVDFLDGAIDIDSQPGRGTRVKVTMQFKFSEDKTKPREKAQDSLGDLAGRKVLLVEDNEINREIACEILSDAGLKVDTAENGKVAVEIFNANADKKNFTAYDFVLMDIQMPLMDGYEATKAIRAIPTPAGIHTPIIALSANAFEEDKTKALDSGMDAHIAKPINVEELLSTLAKFL